MKVFPAIYLYCILELVIHVIKHPSYQISVKINEVIGFVSCFISPSKAFLKDSLKTLLNFKRLCQDTLKLPSKILITFSFQLNKNRPNYDLKTIFLRIKNCLNTKTLPCMLEILLHQKQTLLLLNTSERNWSTSKTWPLIWQLLRKSTLTIR